MTHFRDVHLEIEADEDGAFELMANPSDLVSQDPLLPIDVHLKMIRIEDLSAYYRRGRDGGVTSFHLKELELIAENQDARIEIHADGTLRGAAFHIFGEVGTVAEVFDASGPFDVALRGTAFDSDWWLNGRISSNRQAPLINVQVVIEIPDLEALAGRADPRLDAIGASLSRPGFALRRAGGWGD